MSSAIQPDFKTLFESAPGLYLILEPNLKIVAVSNSYLSATMTRREEITGRDLFEVFPDNPDDATADGVSNLRNSLNSVLKDGIAHSMPVQKYDIRKPDGSFELRYWSTLNTPVLDENNIVLYIIHRVEDVTEIMKLKNEEGKRAKEILNTNIKLQSEKAEMLIKESEEQIQAIFNAAPDAVIVIDEEGVIVKWNNKAEILFGWQAEEVTGRALSESIIPLRYRQAHAAGMKHFLQTGEGPVLHKSIEMQALKKDNSEFDISLSISPARVNNKYFFIGFIRDITEQKKAVEKIKESEQMFANFFYKSPAMEVISDISSGRIIEANDAFAKFTEYEREEMIGKTMVELNLASVGYREGLVDKIKQDGVIREMEIKITTKKGKPAWVSLGVDIINLNGKDCLLKAITDITSRIESEEKISHLNAELEQRVKERTFELEQSLKEISDYQYALDESSIVNVMDKKGIISYVNNNFCNISKYSKEELIGKDHRIVTAGYHPALFFQQFWQTIETGQIWRGELKNKAKDGTIYWVDNTIVSFVDKAGKPYQYIAIATDITERKKAEEKLKEKQLLLTESQRMAHIGSWEINFATNKITWSDEMYRLYAVSPDDFDHSIESYLQLLHPDTRKTVTERMEKNFAGEKQGTFEIRVPLADGSERILLGDGEAFFDSTGKLIRALGTAQDITEKKKLEDLLDKSNRLAKIGNWEADLIKGTVYWSAVTTEIHETETDYVPDLSKGLSFYKEGKNRDRITQCVQTCIEQGTGWDEQLQIVTAKGNVKWIRTIGNAEFREGKCIRFYGSFQDIGELKKAEEAIRLSEEKFRTLVQQAADGIFLCDLDGNYLDANESAASITGYSIDELKQMNGSDIIPAAELKKIPLKLKEIKRGERVYVERIIRRKDNILIEVEISAKLIEGGNVIVIMRDITERKKAEHELRLNKELLEMAEKQAGLGSWDFEVATQTIKWSKQMFRLFGFEISEQPPPSEELLERIHPDDRDTFQTRIKDMLEGKEPIKYEFRTNPGLVPLRYLYAEWSVERNSEGMPVKFSGTILDITERKKAEQGLKSSNFRFEMIARATNDALWEWNFETGELWANETHQQLYGLTVADPVPTADSWKERIHPEDREVIVALQNRSLSSSKTIFISEYRFQNANKEYRNFYDHCYIVRNKEGKAVGMVGSMMDVTEQKKTEHLLQERERHLSAILQTEPECIKQLSSNGEVIDMNPAGLAMIEAESLEEIKGKSMLNIIAPLYRDAFAELAKNVFKGIPGKLEFEIVGLKGTHRWLETHSVPLKNAAGKIISLLSVTRDTTEKKKIEEQIIREKDLSDSIINSLPGIFYLYDENRKFLRWNKNFETVSGYTGEEISIMHPLDFFEGNEKKLLETTIAEVFETGMSEVEAHFYSKKKEKIPYYFSGMVSIFENKKCLLGMGVDITALKKAEQEKEFERRDKESLINSTEDLIWSVSKDLKLIAANEAFIKNMVNTTGVTLQHDDYLLMGHVFSSNILLFWEGLYRKALAGEKFTKEIYTAATNSTAAYWLEISFHPVYQDKDITGLACYARDITERKDIEEKIINNEKKFRALIENSTDGLTVIAADGIVLDMSPSAKKILGYDRDEIVGKVRPDLIHPDDAEKVTGTFRHTVTNSGRPELLEYRHKMPDGSYKWLECSYNNLLAEPYVNAIVLNYRDITERKKTELIIRESEEKYRDLVDNIQDLICTHDLEGRILSANPAATKLLGYTKDEVLNMNLRDIIIPAFRNKFDDYLADISKNGNAKGLMLIQTSSGETRIWEYNNTLRTKGVDKPIVRGLSRDITERKKAEEILQEKEERFRTLFEENPLMNFSIAADGKVLSVNKRGAEQLGYTIQELLGNTVLNVFNKEDHPVVIAQLKECLANPNKTFSWSLSKITKSKEIIWVSETGTAIKDTHGNYSVLIVCENITDRKKNEEEKSQAEKKYRLLFENNITAIYRTTFAGEILECNNAMANFLGYDLADELKRNKADFLYYNPKDRNEFLKLMKEKRVLYNYETKLKQKDGTPIYLLENISLVESSEYPEGVIEGVSIDITERKKAEAEIKNTNEKLRQLTAHLQNIREEERKRIGREIHDDLGQQLTAIKMDVAWVDKKISDESSPVKAKLKNVIKLLDGSNESVRKILNELRLSVLDNHGLIDALEWQGRQFMENTGIPLSFSCSETNLEVEESIATCIFRIFQESLTNITRYAEAKKVISSLTCKDGMIILEIKDDGKGFDTAAIKNKKSFGILGMQERVKSLNGTFQLTSLPGRGTKIIIALPDKSQQTTS